MSRITIDDLATNHTLERSACKAVRGGFFLGFSGFSASNASAILSQQQSDASQALNIVAQTGPEAIKSQLSRASIMADLQSSIHSITAEVTINKAKAAEKAMNAITQYISG